VNETSRAVVENPVEKVLQTGHIVGLANHTVLIGKDGRDIPIDDSAAPIRDDSGALLGVVLIFRDITERRRTELTRSYLAAIVESSDDAIIGKTLDGIITSWNKGAETIFGYPAEEVIGRPVTVLIPPDRHFEEEDILSRLRRGERIEHYVTRRIRKDGRAVTISLSVSPIKGAAGKIIGASKIARDITDQEHAAEALQARERLFHTLADTAPVLVWLSGIDKLCTFFNKRWLDFTGRTMQQELGNGWAEGVHPDDLERCLKIYTSAFDERKEFEMEYRLRRHDGEYRWVLDHGVPLLGPAEAFAGYIGSVSISQNANRPRKRCALHRNICAWSRTIWPLRSLAAAAICVMNGSVLSMHTGLDWNPNRLSAGLLPTSSERKALKGSAAHRARPFRP
jgi:PAS domain S-box-containing protein